MSLAIGLDVSELRMGWAVVDYDTQEPLALGVEDLRERDGGYPEDQVLRAMENVRGVIRHEPDDGIFVVGIEDVYKGPSIKGTIRHAGIVGMATMAARVVFGPSAVYWPIPNGTWLGPLGITPASRKREDVKAATMRWAWSRLVDLDGGDWSPEDADEALERHGQDAADALGIATACARLTEKKAGVELSEPAREAA